MIENSWINIKYDKPHRSQIVLLSINNDVIVGYFHLNKKPEFTNYLTGYPIWDNINYWMALPCPHSCKNENKCIGCMIAQAYEDGLHDGINSSNRINRCNFNQENKND